MECASLIAKFHIIPCNYSSSSDSGECRGGWVRGTKPQGECALSITLSKKLHAKLRYSK